MALTIEQTTQLIQLILNSALMMAIALAWWGVVWLRHGAIAAQLQAHQRRLTQVRHSDPQDVNQVAHLRQMRLHIQARYRLTRHSAFIMHGVLLALVGSVFSLALRTLLSLSGLIPLALLLFVLGIGGLLLSVGLALLEFYQMGLLDEGTPVRARTRRSPMLPLPSSAQATVPTGAVTVPERIAS